MVARSWEGAGKFKKDIPTRTREDNNVQYDVLQFKLDYHKNCALQHPIVYAHNDNFFWGLYFALVVHLIIKTTTSDNLFKDFFTKLGKTDSTKSGFRIISTLYTLLSRAQIIIKKF